MTRQEADRVIARLRNGDTWSEDSYAAGTRTWWLHEEGRFVVREQDAYTRETHESHHTEEALVVLLTRYPWVELAAWAMGQPDREP